jgi:hypothetical protein
MNRNVVTWRGPIGGFAAKPPGKGPRPVSSGLYAFKSPVNRSSIEPGNSVRTRRGRRGGDFVKIPVNNCAFLSTMHEKIITFIGAFPDQTLGGGRV